MALPKDMSGVVLTGHGGPEALEWRDDLPTPEPGAKDVIIKVSAAGVNNTDINTRTAWYSKGHGEASDATWSGKPLDFPRIQGADVCGMIAAVGEEVDQARIGERVLIEPCIWVVDGNSVDPPWYLGSECDGGFAEYVKVDQRYAHAIKTDLTDVELASFPCSYSTAENMLTKARVKSGDRVLVTGASGGVGSAAVQLAKSRSAIVTAMTSPSKAEVLRSAGADNVVSRGAKLVDELGIDTIDVVIDLVAGPNWPQYLAVLCPSGRYAVAGAIAGPMVELDVRTLYLKDLALFGCTRLEPEVFANLVRLIEQGDIKPLVGETFPLKEINAAQTAFAEKAYTGKIVLTLD